MRGLSAILVCLLAITAANAAASTSPCDAPEAREFDFWIGDWNLVNKGLGRDGQWRVTGTAENRVYSILGGCAIVEHWRGVAWDRKTIGFSVRNWDPVKKKWFLLLNWPGKDRPGFGTLEGEFTHGRGEFFSTFKNQAGEDVTQRYAFSDISPDALRWDGSNSTDGGVNWNTYWIMEFSRRPADARPLYNGPWIADGRERHCAQPEAAQLDFLAGAWEGVEVLRGDDGEDTEHAARLSVVPTLEGCALMDFLEVDRPAEGFESFAVRSWTPGESRWTQYEMDTVDPVFEKTTGTVDGERVSFESEGDLKHRVTYERADDGLLVREDATATADGDWQVVSRIELRPTFYNGRETPRQAVRRKMNAALRTDGSEELARLFGELRRSSPDLVNETAMNALGYQLLGGGEIELAIKAFEVNVEAFPDSANAHDSLGEALMKAGRTKSAIEHYEASLKLNPQNTNAEQMLEQLRSND